MKPDYVHRKQGGEKLDSRNPLTANKDCLQEYSAYSLEVCQAVAARRKRDEATKAVASAGLQGDAHRLVDFGPYATSTWSGLCDSGAPVHVQYLDKLLQTTSRVKGSKMQRFQEFVRQTRKRSSSVKSSTVTRSATVTRSVAASSAASFDDDDELPDDEISRHMDELASEGALGNYHH